MVACAAWALQAAGVTTVDPGRGWWTIVDAVTAYDEPVVLHDPLCPATPPDFLARCVAEAMDADAIVVGVRPVTDTVKELVPGPSPSSLSLVGRTLDRDQLWAAASPVVLPPRVVAAWTSLPPLDAPFTALVSALLAHDAAAAASSDASSGRGAVWLTAPASARRIAGLEDLALLT